jgi:serine/threonine-protein kinase
VQSTNNGTIVAQDPQPGPGTAGATVTITLSVSGQVPDTDGLPPDRAQAVLAAYGYAIAHAQYTTALGEGGKVVGTQPQAGTDLAPGSSVTIIINGAPP